MRQRMIGVIGAGTATAEGYAVARQVGRLIAEAGAVLICGGLGGVMEAACRGACDAGGQTIGVLPGPDAQAANAWVTLPVPSNMGHARNVIIAHTAEVMIAVEGEFGTLSEMAIGLKLQKPIVALDSWPGLPGVMYAKTPAEAVAKALDAIDVLGKENF